MMYSWPPTGRMSENISQASKSFSFVPKSKIAGKVGYAVIPGKNGEMAGGYVKCVSADSKNVELAYLNAQWMTSPSVSLQRVMLPYALRDPYRISHYKSAGVPGPLAGAKDYLIQLNNGANNGVVDLLIPGAADYDAALDRAMTGMYSGQSVKKLPRRRGERMGHDHATARSRRPARGLHGISARSPGRLGRTRSPHVARPSRSRRSES